MLKLAEEIIKGRRLHSGEDLSFFIIADLNDLRKGADLIREELCGDRVDLCSIINGRGGKCSENCKFCAQSAHNHTNCDVYGFLPVSEFVKDCFRVQSKGVDRYSIVTAGRTLAGADLEQAVESYRAMHEACPGMILCASHGLMEEKDLVRLREAGVTMYHTNVETSERFFPDICTTHTYDDKKEEIRIAAGRSYFSDGGAVLFRSGANATLTGDMLTTVGNNTSQDREMLADMGYQLKALPAGHTDMKGAFHDSEE